MAIQMAVFMFGGLLLLVAILGGGFEIKELKVPKVGWAARLTSCLCGGAFLFFAFTLDRSLAAAQPLAAAPQAQKGPEVTHIVLVSGPSGELGVRMDGTAVRPESVSLSKAAVRPEPVTSSAAPRSVRPSKPRESNPQATAAPPEVKKRVPWKQKPRKLWKRFKRAVD